MVKRILESAIESKLWKGKAILLFGARQTGKTTLLEQILAGQDSPLWYTADDADVRELFENASSTRLKAVFGEHKLVVIDEAQRIPSVGITLKLITDQMKDVQLIATGSSAFELADRASEPLTGRKWEYYLYPLSFAELVAHHGLLEEKRLLPQRLVFGSYPEVLNNPGNEKEILKLVTDSYLYKDLLMLEGLKKPDKLVKLLQALAFQVGSEVSYNELGRTVHMDNETVEKYVTLLEQAFVVFRLGALSRNLRSEISRSRKIYFYDNGVRNALIAQFGQIETRPDKGALWENYLVAERQKFLHYNGRWANKYFWRTQHQQEIDYIEDADGKLFAWEFKWNPEARVRFSKTFTNAYPNHQLGVVTPKNVEDFLLGE